MYSSTVSSNNVERCFFYLLYILVFSLPLMFFNPMNPMFHRLQLTEIIFVPTFVLFLYLIMTNKIILRMPGIVFYFGVVFILISYFASWKSTAHLTGLYETTKVLYLFLLAGVIYQSAWTYQLEGKLWQVAVYSYIFVLAGGLIGMVLLAFGVSNPMAAPVKIIPISLHIQQWISYVPRVTSFLKPTGNMLGTYLAIVSLPFLYTLFSKKAFSTSLLLRLSLLALVLVTGMLTMSRALVGVMLAVYFGLAYCQWGIPLQVFWRKLLLHGAIIAWLALLFFSVLYPLNVSVKYSTDPSFTKELTLLDNGKYYPNPIYFLRKGKGLEKLQVNFDYAYNHYGWLKYGGYQIFKRHPWLGVGIGNYPKGMKKLNNEDIVPKRLTLYISAQSQYATSLAESGIIGSLVLCVLLISIMVIFWRSYVKSHDRLYLCLFLSVFVLLLIAVDIDMLSYRWLWGYFALGLVFCERLNAH